MKKTISVLLFFFALAPFSRGAFAADPGLTVLYTGGINGWISGVKG